MARETSSLWILKPAKLSCGRGIRLIGSNSHVDCLSNFVVQRYLLHPHLIGGYKYDMRLYVAVTSFDPLKVYLYNQGLVRFATERYTINPRQLGRAFIHLTNFSVNAKNEAHFHAALGDFSGSKWTFEMLRTRFTDLGIDSKLVFSRIADLIVKTLISVAPQVNHQIKHFSKNASPNQNTSFELFGFDVILDDALRPWLLEVNTGPSLSCPSLLDRQIKYSLLADLYTLIGLQLFSQGGQSDRESQKPPPSELFRDLEQKSRNDPLNSQECSFDPRNKSRSAKTRALDTIEQLTSSELEVILSYQEQYYRKGNFQRLFPQPQNFSHYSRYMTWSGAHPKSPQVTRPLQRLGIKVLSSPPPSTVTPSPGNKALWKYLRACIDSGGAARSKLERFCHRVSHLKV